MFVLYLLIACVIHASAYQKNGIRTVKDYLLDAKLHKTPMERRIFEFRRNGIKIDVKVVPLARGDTTKNNDDDHFPEFPVKDMGKCIIEFSLGCIRKRFVRFLETVGRLDEITLLGQDVKLIKSKEVTISDGRSMTNDSDVSIERSVDDLFDSFILRITVPRWNSKREKNQIDVMLDETDVAEGRMKGGGGGGGKGGKCKMMMMGMLMMVKLKLIGLAALKGMMMGGMSLMAAMMMLTSKFGKGGGGPWQSSGPWQGGGGGNLKEIVLLTKSSSGGGGGGCCGGGHGDSYSAPPSSSYGAPSGGGGGYGGGGWGRSFHKRPMTLSHEGAIKADEFNRTPMIGEVTSNAENLDYPDYQDYRESPLVTTSGSATSNWNATNYITFHEYDGTSLNGVSAKDKSKLEPTVIVKGRSFTFNENQSTTVANVIEKNLDSLINTNQSDTNAIAPPYTDEWQATNEKISSGNVPSSDSKARVESRQIESRIKDIPLLRAI